MQVPATQMFAEEPVEFVFLKVGDLGSYIRVIHTSTVPLDTRS